jgi:hypothetical protein
MRTLCSAVLLFAVLAVGACGDGDEPSSRAGQGAAPPERGPAKQAPEVRGSLSETERAELRRQLAGANERLLRAAERLERVTDPRDAAAVARAELRGAEGELAAAADVLGDDVPPDVRERVDELAGRLGELTG